MKKLHQLKARLKQYGIVESCDDGRYIYDRGGSRTAANIQDGALCDNS